MALLIEGSKLYLGWLLSVLVIVPNLLYFMYRPTSVPESGANPNKVMETAERIGQVGVFAIPCFYQTSLQNALEKISLSIMAVFLAIYYTGWIRYFTKGRRYSLLYESLGGLPLPLVISPVAYFLLASVFLWSWPLLVFAIVLAFGHTYVSVQESRKCIKGFKD